MKVRNNTRGRLPSGISADQTSLVIDDGYAPDPNFPEVFGGDAFWTTSDATSKPSTDIPMMARIVQYSENETPSEDTVVKSENIWITGITGDTLTIIRGAGRTVGTNFAKGDWIEVNWAEENAMNLTNMAILNDPITTSYFSL